MMNQLAEIFLQHGISQWGIVNLTELCDDAETEATRKRLAHWLKTGNQAGMQYMQRNQDKALRPDLLLEGCRTVLVVALPYHQAMPEVQEMLVSPATSIGAQGRVAMFAWGRDYHKTFMKRLKAIRAVLETRFPGKHFRHFCDADPLNEKFFAQKAGLGFQGRNTLVINKQFGSWFFLGMIISDLELPSFAATPGILTEPSGVCPDRCSRCIDACPAKALAAPGVLDARRCLSFQTIEHEHDIPTDLHAAVTDKLFGCDICQVVCPFNQTVVSTSEPDFLEHRTGQFLSLEKILVITSTEQFVAEFAGTSLMRAGRISLLRNACIVAVNGSHYELLPVLQELLKDEHELVKIYARWAIQKLSSKKNSRKGIVT